VATYFLKMHQVLEYLGTWQYYKWITCIWKHGIGIINLNVIGKKMRVDIFAFVVTCNNYRRLSSEGGIVVYGRPM